MPEGTTADSGAQILEQLVELARADGGDAFAGDGAVDPAFRHYLDQLARYATGEDDEWTDPRGLLKHARAAWSASGVRAPGEDLIRLRIEEGADWRAARLVLDIIAEDKPFLVDSVSAALADKGWTVSFFLNAVVDAARDEKGRRLAVHGAETVRESMIHAEMDPPVEAGEIAELEADIRRTLADVAVAVADWESMRARLASCIAQLERARPHGVEREDQREAIEFLKWLWDNRFAFLGVRRYRYVVHGEERAFTHDVEADLGILRDQERRVLRHTYDESGHLSPAVKEFMDSGELILIAKANARSAVHRRAYMDYVGVKTFTPDGRVTGEERFVGLFTADSYNRPASDIPLLRSKMRRVIEQAGFVPGGHNEKAIANILETFPRDEMFQIDPDDLGDTAVGILRLNKRPRTKLFYRRDRFDRFVSALVYVPRDRFNSRVREEIGEILRAAFKGRLSAFYPYFGDAALARVHFIIGLEPGAPQGPGLAALEEKIRAVVRTWNDDLVEALRRAYEGAPPKGFFNRYENAFPTSYRERNAAAEALADISKIEGLGSTREDDLRAFRLKGDAEHVLRIKLYKLGTPAPLSALIPTIENMGLRVMQEAGHEITIAGRKVWIHDFLTEERRGRAIDIAGVRTIFEEAFAAVLHGDAEDDGFNALVLAAGLNWREAAMLRGCAKHHLQSGFQFSQAYIEETLSGHPALVRKLVECFHARFHPDDARDEESRTREETRIGKEIANLLNEVDILDEDRIIRRFHNLIRAMTRTNYYQTGEDGRPKPYLSFKVASRELEELPAPRPYREIFVSSPRVDGVHLRFGPVARGGLRWSDRREDFRTEVLGLVKAQQVKNAVIVPVGSKGGFYPKQLPEGGDREAVFEEGREAYKYFIRGLLDVTDNLVDGEIVRPPQVVARDPDDPYLVVAADKGTARFSDTANGVALEYGFWLGDAFASGGSAGYDHKAMGITAKGAWEAVKRHFRELGKDIQNEEFTVAGVGDMSGDVFGNGMLLSRKIRLVAAFDHRDIFIDPNPDAETSYQERERLFALPRSSWQDYDKSLISEGGGVFSRTAKSIPLSPEIRAVLGTDALEAPPAAVIRAILKAEVDLIWLGGIGTYFKAPEEDNWRVGDRTNDAVRVDADEVRVKVIGEGANLGLTQRARIVFARRGGRINTDAIDNSAGVDSSDHEVNIKIVLKRAIEQGALKPAEREPLLEQMTEDVAEHVLRHNYDQTRALSMMEATAAADIDSAARMMTALERAGRLDRKIEVLPDAEALSQLKSHGRGLSRPEAAVLMAYAKIWLFDEIIASGAPDDPHFRDELFAYFPEPLHAFEGAVEAHRLRREIVATRLSNELVDTCGMTFAYRAHESTGASLPEVALSYEAARRIFDLSQFARAVDDLDNVVDTRLQTDFYIAAAELLRRQVNWLLIERVAEEAATAGVGAVLAKYKPGVDELKAALPDVIPEGATRRIEAQGARYVEAGAPDDLALAAARLPYLAPALDIADLAGGLGWPVAPTGRLYFALGADLGLDALRVAGESAQPTEHFDRLAMRRLVDDIRRDQRTLAGAAMRLHGAKPDEDAGAAWTSDVLAGWRAANEGCVRRLGELVDDLDLGSGASVGKLALAAQQVRELVAMSLAQ